MTERKELEIEEIRTLTLEALKRFKDNTTHWGGGLQSTTLLNEVEYLAAEQKLIPSPDGQLTSAKVTDEEVMKIFEVISNFMMEGILMWGLNRSNIVPPFMSLTSYGKKVLDNEDVVPHDPENYIKTFKNKVPDADELILMYLTESVQTFRNNNLLAASVMLGVASEASFNLLFQEFTNSVTGPKKDKFEKLLSNISTKQKFDELIKEIALIKNRLPIELQENLQSELNGIFNLIKYQRNDSGHPTGKKISRDEVFVSLRLFIIYCGKVHSLIDWLKNNAI